MTNVPHIIRATTVVMATMSFDILSVVVKYDDNCFSYQRYNVYHNGDIAPTLEFASDHATRKAALAAWERWVQTAFSLSTEMALDHDLGVDLDEPFPPPYT